MDADLVKLCEQAFDDGVEDLFQQVLAGRHNGFFEAPPAIS
jgi:hypothetical protein